jgi:hypothetical protein
LVVTSGARDRLSALLDGARRLADPNTELGKELRQTLPQTTRLSPAGIELALRECLELEPSEAELAALCASVRPSPRVHVSLSSTVFVAAHRAVALALASSPDVCVRPSRRDPTFLRLLERATGSLFRVVETLVPRSGEELWAYGSDATLAALRKTLPAGVRLHAHGSGVGAAVVSEDCVNRDTAAALSRDMVPFDQRGCLSPRVALVGGGEDAALEFSSLLAVALDEQERSVPLGDLDHDELAAVVRFRDTLAYAGRVLPAGRGWVGTSSASLFAPVGRNMHVIATVEPVEVLGLFAGSIAALGVAGPPALHRSLAHALPGARSSPLGAMQRPPFDGPVDQRPARSAPAWTGTPAG